MNLKLIACDVFTREICICVAESPNVIDLQFLEIGEHVNSDRLRSKIQEAIDRCEHATRIYDAVLLGFGLCGNSINGIKAGKYPIIVPRAHDCCTILLGDKRKFEQRFRDKPSTPFSSTGYLERGDYFLRSDDGETTYATGYQQLVEQYGEEDARYIWDAMHPKRPDEDDKAVFIEIPETAHLRAFATFCKKAEEEKKPVERLDGTLDILRKFTRGEWDPDTFLTVQPGQTIKGVYDWDQVVRAE